MSLLDDAKLPYGWFRAIGPERRAVMARGSEVIAVYDPPNAMLPECSGFMVAGLRGGGTVFISPSLAPAFWATLAACNPEPRSPASSTESSSDSGEPTVPGSDI